MRIENHQRPATGLSWQVKGLALSLVAVWAQGALAVPVPVFSVSVDGGAAVSFENDQVCAGAKAVQCFGTGSAGDLIISSFELNADPDPYVAGSFNFYNASLTNTLSVVATILFPMSGVYASPVIALATGLVSNVFGGGILNIVTQGFIDSPGSTIASISEISPGVPFSFCDNFGVDPGCQNAVIGLGSTQGGPLSLAVASAIGLRLSFNLSPDTTATIGFDPGGELNGSAAFSIVPQVVPLPAGALLFGSALSLVGWMRRRPGAAMHNSPGITS